MSDGAGPPKEPLVSYYGYIVNEASSTAHLASEVARDPRKAPEALVELASVLESLASAVRDFGERLDELEAK